MRRHRVFWWLPLAILAAACAPPRRPVPTPVPAPVASTRTLTVATCVPGASVRLEGGSVPDYGTRTTDAEGVVAYADFPAVVPAVNVHFDLAGVPHYAQVVTFLPGASDLTVTIDGCRDYGIRIPHWFERTRRPLVGALRTVDYPAALTHSYRDDTGPRRVLFTSWFPALRIWRDHRDEAQHQLDLIARAGYQGIRIFRALGADRNNGDDDSPWWSGRTVNPAWSIPAFVEFAQAAKARGLKLHVTEGHAWNDPTRDELVFTQAWASAVHAAGLDDTIAAFECFNEYWQNTAYGQSDAQVDIARRMMAIVTSTLVPTPLVGIGAANGSEAPEAFDWASRGGSTITYIHGSRDMPAAIKRAFGSWYWEGDPGHWPKPIWNGEPCGPGDGVSVAQCNDAGELLALYAMYQITGQAVVHVSGAGIWSRRSLDADPWFYEIPKWLEALPEDVAQATHIPGGGIWWWRLPDGRCATVTAEGWPYQVKPAATVASWTAYGPGGVMLEGTGHPVLPEKFGGALIVAECR